MSTTWRLTAFADFKPLADAVERLDEVFPPIALSWLLFEDGAAARMDVLFESRPDESAFRAASGRADDIAVSVEPMPDEDWGRISLEGLKPVDVDHSV